ncbi:MAG TPA: preprotein translocase subunit SecG [Caldithrix abyssi]|uniref:Protein-export membrane protein SecG n=1 Tax=Caldithrix abyssi TaxID=187145 RepID=A0A7V4TY88_CALAY|nr:preprotein translocase subunit SecG [Caldithrix abyssi]
MYTFLIILFILISFAMVVVILLQAGKGQGLAGAIGGGAAGTSIFGGRGAADFLSKATTWLAALYMALAVLIGVLYKNEAQEAQQSLIQQRVQEQQNTLPETNVPLAPIEQNQPTQNQQNQQNQQ